MKKHFLTLERAQRILNHYRDKVIGNPIDSKDHPHWLISQITLATENGIDWNVLVISKDPGYIGVDEDYYGYNKYSIIKFLLAYLRETNTLRKEDENLWWDD